VKTVPISYSKLRTGLVLATLTSLAVFPLMAYLLLPGLYQHAEKSLATLLLVYGAIGALSLTAFALIAIKLKKFRDSEEAVLIYNDGIWSNVSGISEVFVPWDQVERAFNSNSGNGLNIVKVEQKEPVARSAISRFSRSTNTVAIWPMTLEKSSFDLVEIINDYVRQYNEAPLNAEPITDSSDDYVQKKAA